MINNIKKKNVPISLEIKKKLTLEKKTEEKKRKNIRNAKGLSPARCKDLKTTSMYCYQP